MEHGVYVCGWLQNNDGFTLWVKSRPWIRAQGATYPEAEERFLEAILDAGGAIQAIPEYDPPIPLADAEAKYGTPELFLICGDNRFDYTRYGWAAYGLPFHSETKMQFIDLYYEVPLCRHCGGTPGPRSAIPLSIDAMTDPGFDGGFASIGPMMIRIFSEDFLALLSPAERNHLELRPINYHKKTKKKYWELLGPAGPPFVAVAGLRPDGCQCAICGFRSLGYVTENRRIHDYVARTSLPKPLPEVFTVGGQPDDVQLCIRGERWRKLIGKKGTRGVVSHPLGVVDDGEVMPEPELRCLQVLPPAGTTFKPAAYCHIVDLVRLVGWQGRPVGEVRTLIEPLVEKHTARLIDASTKDLYEVDSDKDPPIVQLTELGKVFARQVLGPCPENP
jgi:hypothetical protein